MKIHAGTSGFAHKEWQGKFYPEKIPSRDMLRFYSGRLNTVEINNTFYHMPRESVLAAWAAQVTPDFVFAIKAPRVITHIKQLRNVFGEIDYLFRSLPTLDGKLGPVLFQFPKTFRADLPRLEDFLAIIPEKAPCAFDFRSPTWLEAGAPDLLRKKGMSWCIEDTDENPVRELVSTAAWGYLRLRRDYADGDLGKWAEKILSQKWEKAFVYFKHEGGDAKGPNTAVRFQELVDSGRRGKAAAG